MNNRPLFGVAPVRRENMFGVRDPKVTIGCQKFEGCQLSPFSGIEANASLGRLLMYRPSHINVGLEGFGSRAARFVFDGNEIVLARQAERLDIGVPRGDSVGRTVTQAQQTNAAALHLGLAHQPLPDVHTMIEKILQIDFAFVR